MPRYKDYDDYISSCEDFAQPMLRFLRDCVNEACPEVNEEFKWNFPCFTYKGSILCYMSGFKKHATFGFWLGGLMDDPENLFSTKATSNGMGQFGKMTSRDDLPGKDVLIRYIKHAMQLTDEGKKLPTTKKKDAKEHPVPEVLLSALKENAEAKSTFEGFSQSKRNDYIEWITSAKTEKTQLKRLEQTIEWLSEGKPRNWKYMKKW